MKKWSKEERQKLKDFYAKDYRIKTGYVLVCTEERTSTDNEVDLVI